MPMQSFDVNGKSHQGYLALPPSGKGPGLLFLHAWWGLTDFFKSQCDRFAAEGFVTFAPDFFDGKQTADREEAGKLVSGSESDFPAMQALAEAAAMHLQKHPAVTGKKLAVIGFSFGAAYALVLDEALPEAFDRVVLFYGMAGADVNKSKAKVLAHFAETDEFEPIENVHKMKAPNLEVYVYPGTGHWFFESNRSDAYNAEAAKLAWERTLAFLKG